MKDVSLLAQATERCATAFFESMDNDFSTPTALAAVFDLINAINAHVVSRGETTSDMAARQKVAEAYGLLLQCLGILGLVPQVSQAAISKDDQITQGLIELLLDIRDTARKQKNYKAADYVRDKMASFGIVLEDTPLGTKVRVKG